MRFGFLGALGTVGGSGGTTPAAGPATHLSVGAPPSVTVGTPFVITVLGRDASDNLATSYTGTIHLTSSDGAAVLPADAAAVAGVKTFTVTLNTVGTQTITATDTVTGTITGVSGPIVVSPVVAPSFVPTYHFLGF